MKRFRDTKYLVTEDGRVYSEHRNIFLKPFLMKNGYLVYRLGKKEKQLAHRLVAIVYIKNELQLPEVNHIDGNKTNNSVHNLEWCTHQENVKHAYSIGLKENPKGSKVHNAKLNEEKVRQIRQLYGTNNYSCRQIGEMFGVKSSTIDYIINYKNWKHVK